MEKLLDVEIITPEEIIYQGKVISITVPGTQSPFSVLYNHAPIVSSLENGTMRLIDENKAQKAFKSSNGFIEVRNNKVSILVDSVEII
jgi:F-type H+-transporting ATPase subunit epsilon